MRAPRPSWARGSPFRTSRAPAIGAFTESDRGSIPRSTSPLAGIVHFYDTRDVLPRCAGPFTEAEALAASCWPAPEVGLNVNAKDVGDLRLGADEEAELVQFPKTLSDGWTP